MTDPAIFSTSHPHETQTLQEEEEVVQQQSTTTTKEGPLSSAEFDRLNELETDLESLHESLSHLLGTVPVIPKTPSSTSPQIDGITEDGLKQFRSRVARRIYFYSPHLREFHALIERLPDGESKTKAEELYRYHKDSLTKFKTEMSGWWKNIERQFHRLRMASLLSKEDLLDDDDSGDQVGSEAKRKLSSLSNGHGPSGWIASLRNNVSSGSKVTAGLRDIKQSMQVEVERMEATGQALEESSQKLEHAGSLFSEFGSHLSAARKKLSNLKRRAEMDTRYVWWAFVLFASVCIFIIVKRTRVLRTGVWVANKVLSLTLFSTKTVYSAVSPLVQSSSHPVVPRHAELRSLTANVVAASQSQPAAIVMSPVPAHVSTPAATTNSTVELLQSILEANEQPNTVINASEEPDSPDSRADDEQVARTDVEEMEQQADASAASKESLFVDDQLSDGSTAVLDDDVAELSDAVLSEDIQSFDESVIEEKSDEVEESIPFIAEVASVVEAAYSNEDPIPVDESITVDEPILADESITVDEPNPAGELISSEESGSIDNGASGDGPADFNDVVPEIVDVVDEASQSDESNVIDEMPVVEKEAKLEEEVVQEDDASNVVEGSVTSDGSEQLQIDSESNGVANDVHVVDEVVDNHPEVVDVEEVHVTEKLPVNQDIVNEAEEIQEESVDVSEVVAGDSVHREESSGGEDVRTEVESLLEVVDAVEVIPHVDELVDVNVPEPMNVNDEIIPPQETFEEVTQVDNTASAVEHVPAVDTGEDSSRNTVDEIEAQLDIVQEEIGENEDISHTQENGRILEEVASVEGDAVSTEEEVIQVVTIAEPLVEEVYEANDALVVDEDLLVNEVVNEVSTADVIPEVISETELYQAAEDSSVEDLEILPEQASGQLEHVDPKTADAIDDSAADIPEVPPTVDVQDQIDFEESFVPQADSNTDTPSPLPDS